MERHRAPGLRVAQPDRARAGEVVLHDGRGGLVALAGGRHGHRDREPAEARLDTLEGRDRGAVREPAGRERRCGDDRCRRHGNHRLLRAPVHPSQGTPGTLPRCVSLRFRCCSARRQPRSRCRGPASTVRSEITIDRDALRANLRRLTAALGGAELWAVVKADAYGHGAATVSETALDEGAKALCVATVGEGLELRDLFPAARIIVLSPAHVSEHRAARAGGLELVVVDPPWPEGIPLHVKVDTGMGRWGISDLVDASPDVVGLLSHFASADVDPEFTAEQIARFGEIAARHPAPDAPSREQRRDPEVPGRALRCRACGARALRAVAVRGRSGRRRPAARALLAQPHRSGQAARARREHRLRPPVRRHGADVGSGSSRSDTRTGGAAT